MTQWCSVASLESSQTGLHHDSRDISTCWLVAYRKHIYNVYKLSRSIGPLHCLAFIQHKQILTCIYCRHHTNHKICHRDAYYNLQNTIPGFLVKWYLLKWGNRKSRGFNELVRPRARAWVGEIRQLSRRRQNNCTTCWWMDRLWASDWQIWKCIKELVQLIINELT